MSLSDAVEREGLVAKVALSLLDSTDGNTQEIDLDALQSWNRYAEHLNVDQTIFQVRTGVVAVVTDDVECFSSSRTEQCSRNVEVLVQGVSHQGTNLVEGNSATINNVEDLLIEGT